MEISSELHESEGLNENQLESQENSNKEQAKASITKNVIPEVSSEAIAKDTPHETSDEFNLSQLGTGPAEMPSKPAAYPAEHPDFPEALIQEEEEGVDPDFGKYNREDLIKELQNILDDKDIKWIEREVNTIKAAFDELTDSRKQESLKKFLEKGGSENDFSFKNDALDNRFEALMNRYKARKTNYTADIEKQKEINLQKKHEILETLRKLVDAEETTTSIGALKKIQEEWKSVGPIPYQFNRSLWASYNALIDRFYDNRSIYFELKELDRKKNLESKMELCEKAERLARESNLREAIKQLNELHEEFKHIGPVPSEQQEIVWRRFKAASDQIYSRRKEYFHELKKTLQANLEQKKKIIEEISAFQDFDSESITEWNNKTRLILEIQKRWESIGGIPKEQTKIVNKSFWATFKAFFSNKNKFFKKLESKREENLQRKEDLIKQAIAIKDSDDWESTADRLKELQKEWKNLGPVPEKFKNEIFDRFKKVCDEFFENRRNHGKELEVKFMENLKRKEEICADLEKMITENLLDIEKFQSLQEEFEQVGFVPRNSIKKIQKRFKAIEDKFLESSDVSEEKKNEIKFSAEIHKIRSGPDSDRKLQRKETEIRKLINKLENDIAIWNNNLEFFKESDTADKLRAEFNLKIEKAQTQLNELKEELKLLVKM